MSGGRTSARGLEALRGDLSGRDLAIVGQVAELRLMTSHQIEAIHFPPSEHASALSAARLSRKALARLAADRLLVPIERRVGGVRAGSGATIYGLGPVGHRILDSDGARPRRYREPTRLFTEHTLAVGDVVIALTLAARRGECELLGCQAEPRCWREFSGLSGRSVVKPDLFVALGVGEFEERWFIEVDRGTEHLPALIRKCRLYDAYYRTGAEQARHGVFPRVCFVVPDDERAERLAKAIAADRRLAAELITVTTTGEALGTLLSGGES